MLNVNDNLINQIQVIGVDAYTVLQIIAKHVNLRSNTAWPGLQRIRKMARVMDREGNMMDMPEKRARLAIKTLIDHELISRSQVKSREGKFGKTVYTILTDQLSIFLNAKGAELEEENRVVDLGNAGNDQHNIIKEKEHIVEKPKASNDTPAKEIVSYLNERLDSNYRHTTKKTISLIKARMREGFTVDDFKAVIDYKADQWKDTPNEMYLRPITLFSPKFEGYLQLANKKANTDNFEDENQAEQYKTYLRWVKLRYPKLLANIQYLSNAEFKSYKDRKYLDGLKGVSMTQEKRCLEDAHNQFSANPNIQKSYPTVFAYHCFKMKSLIKPATVI